MNIALIASTFLAGLLWTVIGETIVMVFFPTGFSGDIVNVLFTSVYFSLLALFSLAAALLSEHAFSSILANKTFFRTVIITPQLPGLLSLSFFIVLIGSGVLQFIYQLDTNGQKKETYDDYYLLVDNTGSMEWNDPQNERIRFLSQLVNKLPESKRVALVSFNTMATVNVALQFATSNAKNDVNRLITTLHSDLATDIVGALETTATVLSNDSKRKGIVLFISDGAPSEDFMGKVSYLATTLSIYKNKNIPIYTIMLRDKQSPSEEIELGIDLLKRISTGTGGTHSTVDNFNVLDMTIQSTLAIEAIRNLLTRRVSDKNGFPLYNILHIVFLTLIGLLIGYVFYGVFPYIPIRIFLLLQVIISGLLAGLILEIPMQAGLSPVICRAISNILLSTLPLIGIKQKLKETETGGLSNKELTQNDVIADKKNKFLRSAIDDNTK
jgi:hypothetical protein